MCQRERDGPKRLAVQIQVFFFVLEEVLKKVEGGELGVRERQGERDSEEERQARDTRETKKETRGRQ